MPQVYSDLKSTVKLSLANRNIIEHVNERESVPGLGCDPIKLSRILEEILLDFNQLTPVSAAVGALITFEGAPNLSRAVKWKDEPPESPLRQYFEKAKSYLLTLQKIESQAENRQFLNPEDDPDEANDEEPTSNLIGKLHAYEDVLAVLNKIFGS